MKAGPVGRRGSGVEPLEGRRLFCASHLPGSSLWAGGDVVGPSTGDPFVAIPAAPSTAPSLGPPPGTGTRYLTANGANAPLSGLPALDSFPSAPAAVFLDFNGNGTYAPYDADGNPAAFGPAEQEHIALAWRHVAEYFAPFNVNVTTVRPSVPAAWGLVTNTLTGPGWSYVGVFPNSPSGSPMSFNPAGDARTRQSGIAHEIGHNFGLWHQSDYDLLGTKTNEYSSGYDATHGPVMGVDFAQSVHKWFIGHDNNSPSTLQDDVATIAGRIAARPGGGDGFRPDDVGGTPAAAAPLAAVGGVQTATGIIERMADADAYSFASPGGRVAIGVTPAAPSALAPRVEVYDASGTLLAARDDTDLRNASDNTLAVALDLPAGTYYAVVSSHGDYGDLGSYAVTASSLPDGWRSQWVGRASLGGTYAAFDAGTGGVGTGTFTVAGSGAGLSGAADEAQYAGTTLRGDGSIVARVVSPDGDNTAAQAGLDVRETTAAGSRHVALVATANGLQFLRRTSTGGGTTITTASAAASGPVWLKLERVGNAVTASQSADGVGWAAVGSATVPMATDVTVGLIAGARDTNKLTTATFDNVSWAGGVNAPPAAPNALPAPAGLSAAPGAGTALALTWVDVDGEAGYVVERSVDGTTFAQAGTAPAGATTYTDAGLWGSMRYFYRVRAADAAGGRSAPSTVATAVNRPNAPSGLAVTSWQTTKLILNWRDVSGETGYRVERATGGGDFAPIATVGANVPSYTDSGLAVATEYAYRVIPLSPLGDGPAAAAAPRSTRLPAATGLAITTTAATRMALRWDPVPGATGYRIDRSTDGTTFSTGYASRAGNVTAFEDAGVAPLGEYYYRVVATNATSQGMPADAAFAAAPAADPLPAPWQSTDVGSPAGAGATGAAAGAFTVLAGGTDVWNASDQFRFTYLPLVGDGQIVARVTALEKTDAWAKAGVMVRETLAADATEAFLNVSGGNGTQFMWRASAGGTSSALTNVAGRAAPYWVKLVRTGDAFAAYASPDGVTWTSAGSATVPMASRAYVGLAVASHTATTLARATFDSVRVTTAAPAVRATQLNGGAAQRSAVTGYRVDFARPVATLDAGAITLARRLPDGASAAVPTTAVVAADGMSLVVTFAAPGSPPASPEDGVYDLVVRPTLIRDQAGQAALGPDLAATFHRLFGDADGDGDSDNADLFQFRASYGRAAGDPAYRPEFDYDNDGDVDNADLFQVRSRRGVEYKGY